MYFISKKIESGGKMDREDVENSQKEIIVPKVRDKRFKIKFLSIVIVCIIIMFLDQFMNFLVDLPEIFYKGDYIFHILKSIINLCSQLAVSIFSAILFYYIVEFINSKKKIGELEEIRKYILFILYKHMKIICNIKSFKNLNRNKERLKGEYKWFSTVDIPILLKDYINHDGSNLKMELEEYFFKSGKDYNKKIFLVEKIKKFKKEVDELLKYKNIDVYKEYKEDLEGLESIYKDLYEKFEVYEEAMVTDLILDDIVDVYIEFLYESINIFNILQRYILCIKNKKIIEFLKMRD